MIKGQVAMLIELCVTTQKLYFFKWIMILNGYPVFNISEF